MRSAWLCLLVACGPAPLEPFEEPASQRVHSDRALLRDEADRVVVMHGVNARVNGIFDVTFDDGRLPLEDIPAFEESDAQRMREMGLTLLRLPIHWSAIEPQQGTYDETYLDRVESVVDSCARSGVHVILDFHQDAYSKEIGEDGAPLWAIVPPPDMLLGGPLGDSLSQRLLSGQVQAAFATFFSAGTADTQRLQTAFAAMARHVAERFEADDHVLGYDLYNEPTIGDPYLPAFHEQVGRAIREVDARHLLLFEPSGFRNLTERAAISRTPFFDDGGVYALHIYTFIFSRGNFDLAQLTKEDLESNFESARREARSWNVPMLVGEWGIGPDTTNMDLYIRYTYELLDETFSSTTVWLWKEQSQGSWGFYAWDGTTWTEREHVRRAHERIYAERIAGEPASMSFDVPSGRFELTYEGRLDAAPHWIIVPLDFQAFRVSCDGRLLDPQPARDPALARVSVLCAGRGMHTLTIDTQ